MITASTGSKARLWLAALGGLVLNLACQNIERTPAPGSAEIKPLRAGVHRGVCLAHSHQSGGSRGYGSQASKASKAELAALGVDWISLTPFGWQRTLSATRIEINPRSEAGESDRRLEEEVGQARALGMKVMMKPHLWISASQWRGHIAPEGGEVGWGAWFESYTTFLLHYARLSERLGVESFVVGLELASASPRREDWIEVIEAVREVYSGDIVYASNWNEIDRVAFWDKVDVIGVQFFAPLAESTEDPYEALVAAMDRHLDDHEALSLKYDKPVIFTEFGFKPIASTAISPHTWPGDLPASARRYDERIQAMAYRAVLNTAGRRPFIHGIYVWKWFTDLDSSEEGLFSFSPRDKLAAEVLSMAFRRP